MQNAVSSYTAEESKALKRHRPNSFEKSGGNNHPKWLSEMKRRSAQRV